MDALDDCKAGASRAMRFQRRARCLGVGLTWIGMMVAVAAAAAEGPAADRPRPSDDWTFRPTVIIRKGSSQGSGSIIASVQGETLVLTAAHVVEDRGPLKVEFHRYNLGLERDSGHGKWPRSIAAEVVGADVAADVAILQIKGQPPVPYVARLAVQGAEPRPGTLVTSIGIDRGTKLSSWATRIAEINRFEIEGTGAERWFLVTHRPPDFGRSGGGLFLANGDLVGVCVGRAGFVRGRTSGVFASRSSIRRLLRTHDLEARIDPGSAPYPARARTRPSITTTQAQTPP